MAVPQESTGQSICDDQNPHAGALLLVYADAVDDLECVRIATENRVRSLRQVKGMDGTPEEARLAGMVDALKALEHQATLDLKRAMRAHPLGPWVKATKGVGEKQAARLLAAIGDPYWHRLHNRPRTVSELWAYCGWRPDQKRRKGVKSNWSSVAKSCSWRIARSIVKSQGPLAAAYYEHRERTAVTHPEWTPGHSHNDGLRFLAKRVLREMWRESRNQHATLEPFTTGLARAGSSPTSPPADVAASVGP